MNDKNITNYNNKSQSHGYQKWYGYHKLIYRGNYKNNERIGYTEWHFIEQTRYYI